jgi:hypothetical protein
LAGLEPATFGSSGKHTNNYTTKAFFDGIYKDLTTLQAMLKTDLKLKITEATWLI